MSIKGIKKIPNCLNEFRKQDRAIKALDLRNNGKKLKDY